MPKIIGLLICLLLGSSIACFAKESEKKKASSKSNSAKKNKIKNPLKTEDSRTFYAMGFALGRNLEKLKLSRKELDDLFMGAEDAAQGKKAVVDMNIYTPKIQEMFKSRMKFSSKDNKKKGNEFRKKVFEEDPKMGKTKSGLVYRILKKGSSKRPKAEDTVEVHYHGTLIDGTVFDSSLERGKTIRFPLDRVIKGWTEGIQLIGEGGKIKLFIPPELGYGDAGAPPKIPGGATLIFEIELFKVNPNP